MWLLEKFLISLQYLQQLQQLSLSFQPWKSSPSSTCFRPKWNKKSSKFHFIVFHQYFCNIASSNINHATKRIISSLIKQSSRPQTSHSNETLWTVHTKSDFCGNFYSVIEALSRVWVFFLIDSDACGSTLLTCLLSFVPGNWITQYTLTVWRMREDDHVAKNQFE